VRKRSTVVAWSMLATYVASVSVGYFLMVTNGIFQDDPANQLGLLLTFTAFMVVGAVIVARRPDNTIGWIFSAIGLLAGTGTPAWQYAEYAYAARGGTLPGAILGAWYAPLWFYSAIGLAFVFTPLLFPTGQLLSPRWRPIALLAAVTTAALVVLSAVQPTLGASEGYSVRNPIGVTGVPDLDNSALGEVLIGLFNLCIGAAVLSLVLRFRRSHGVQRQQLKWFTYAGALMFLWLVLGDYLLPNLAILGALSGVIYALVPMATGVAVLRYRLYDIDRLINRTLVYGLLTALLAGIYAGAVLVLGQVFGGVGRDPPSWAVAGATLAVAALFQPARRRIQQVVDRRFNRRKYNAAKTIERFSTRLRDQVDLDTLSAELVTVVDQTMQPTTTSLWLRPTTEVVASDRGREV
jgi:hypothetical protein